MSDRCKRKASKTKETTSLKETHPDDTKEESATRPTRFNESQKELYYSGS